MTSTTPGAGTVTVGFTPGSDGGSPITGYDAQCRQHQRRRPKNDHRHAASPITVTDLTSGKNYHCRVRATNAIGTGPYSAYGATVPVT